jgi:putative ABC transport system ATP-binding protein
LTVFENVDISRKLSKSSLDTDELLEAVYLSDRKNLFPTKLSGGEMQRVSIARALCKNPKILLCDEPTGALDSTTGKNILILLRDIAEKYGITIIMVTHNAEIAKMADKVITMKDGGILSIETNATPLSADEVEL